MGTGWDGFIEARPARTIPLCPTGLAARFIEGVKEAGSPPPGEKCLFWPTSSRGIFPPSQPLLNPSLERKSSWSHQVLETQVMRSNFQLMGSCCCVMGGLRTLSSYDGQHFSQAQGGHMGGGGGLRDLSVSETRCQVRVGGTNVNREIPGLPCTSSSRKLFGEVAPSYIRQHNCKCKRSQT